MERTKDVPGISLVVPVYNVQEYLPECLDSLLGQSFAAIEIILVDDGSTDASAEICDRYAARDGRIRVVHQQNAGVSKARNVGIRLARGKYLGFVDGDDWVDRDYCKRLYETLIDYRADISICSYYVARSRKTIPEAADGKITIYDRKEAIRMLYEDVRSGVSVGTSCSDASCSTGSGSPKTVSCVKIWPLCISCFTAYA